MGYRTLADCVADLAATGQLIRIEEEIDPCLEAAEIQRRVYAAGGPAIFYARVRGCRFPMVSNLFGSLERLRYIFRDSLAGVSRLVEMKVDPGQAARRPLRYLSAARAGLHMLPRRVRRGPILANEIKVHDLPQVVSWPRDGGPFVTLPVVYTEDPDAPGWRKSNLGMYRVQLGGNEYRQDEEVGLHYQIHRGIGVHHAAAIRRGEPLRVNVIVGGPPALAVAAVMPLPEGLPEIAFAGALGGRRVALVQPATGGLPFPAEADFCITGTIDPERQLPEGPFGDHLGYYSLAHDFPVLRVEKVYHRAGAIWSFTTVGRPPQEDTSFGQFIHELTRPVVPTLIAGVRAVHAVDAAGVHPLLLAIGSERYVPYAAKRQPREILTQANAILGQGQMSLAKYLIIAAEEDSPELRIHDIAAFLQHVLARVDWRRDLHFQTRTTIDTLDYSGTSLNEGSKVVIAAAGPKVRDLPSEIPPDLRLPDGFREPRLALPGVLLVQGPPHAGAGEPDGAIKRFCSQIDAGEAINRFHLVVMVDDSDFAAASLNNFLWVTFTRSNPAADVYGVGASTEQKHWGCRGALVIDARAKPHHAPPLVEDPQITRRVDQLAARGGPLAGIL
ncbi:MAG TPA: UbiD family decarboxylase [Pirellulales bacterium]|jgi:4-hydroxy-3-polyprenylbenzoate decarboxylase